MKTNAMRKESDCVQTIHAGHIDLHVKVALWRVDDWDDKVETTLRWKEKVHPPFATTSSPIDFPSHHLSEGAIGKKTMKEIDERIACRSPLSLLQIKALTKFTSIRKLMETILSPIMIHYTAWLPRQPHPLTFQGRPMHWEPVTCTQLKLLILPRRLYTIALQETKALKWWLLWLRLRVR